MRITIPEDDGDLRLLPEGPAVAMLEDFVLTKSSKGNPVLYATFTLVEEMANADPEDESTIGARILESYSLLPQAIFKLKKTWKAVTGEKMPHGDYEEEDILQMVKDSLCGSVWDVILETNIPPGKTEADARSQIADMTLREA